MYDALYRFDESRRMLSHRQRIDVVQTATEAGRAMPKSSNKVVTASATRGEA